MTIPQKGEFHWRDGWMFSRNEDGSVVMYNKNFGDLRNPQGAECARLTIPPNEWASIVASVSNSGGTSESYHGTLAFHMGKLPYPSPGRRVPHHGSGPDNIGWMGDISGTPYGPSDR